MSDQLTKNLEKLPEYCFGTYLTTGETILLMKGERGYRPCANQRPAEELNAELGVTKAQAAAMSMGSIAGFDVPGADPDAYDEDGKPAKHEGARRTPTLSSHHMLVASVIRDFVSPCPDGTVASPSSLFAARGIAESLANAFREEDASFDPPAFLRACNVERSPGEETLMPLPVPLISLESNHG